MINHPNRSRKISTHEHDYESLLAGVTASFRLADGPLFRTDATGLNDLYLSSLPRSQRQYHNCSACRHFIERFGGLVTINDKGYTIPAIWNADVPGLYQHAFLELYEYVRGARVISTFHCKERVWGTPRTGKWTHPSVYAKSVYVEGTLTAGQRMAADKENFRTVTTALREFTAPMLDEALRILNAAALPRSEKFIGPVQWLRDLHKRPRGRLGENILWWAIATAPEGYCHPRASVIAPLLEDIMAGLPFDTIKRRFSEKVAPLQYQRPQAAPKAGNIAASEKLVEKLGIEKSLERRFARLGDLKVILWSPSTASAGQGLRGGVFGHLKARGESVPQVNLPAQTMTWSKFCSTVLPSAQQIELSVPSHGRFIALTTAVHDDAPPIFKWDDGTNPVAWYVYPRGSGARQWGLSVGEWTKVTAITPLPTMWGSRPMPFIGEGVVLVLEGAVDSHDAGNALFPECLRDDLHGARATIEAYSKGVVLSGRDKASACGYDIRKDKADCRLRVFDGSWSVYNIDRWD